MYISSLDSRRPEHLISALFSIFQKHHPAIHRDLNTPLGSSQPDGTSTSQTSMASFIVEHKWKSSDLRSQRLTDAVVNLVGQTTSPLSLVDQPAFHELMELAQPSYTLPSGRHLSRKLIPEHAVSILIPPLHRGCDLSASIVRPQSWPGRRWRQKGGRTVALVAQWWYTGCSDITMDAMVALKFWACSKQSHKGRRGGRSLTGRSNEAGGRHTHRHGGRMDAQWSAIGRPIKIRTVVNIVYQFEQRFCLPCTTIVPPLADR